MNSTGAPLASARRRRPGSDGPAPASLQRHAAGRRGVDGDLEALLRGESACGDCIRAVTRRRVGATRAGQIVRDRLDRLRGQPELSQLSRRESARRDEAVGRVDDRRLLLGQPDPVHDGLRRAAAAVEHHAGERSAGRGSESTARRRERRPQMAQKRRKLCRWTTTRAPASRAAAIERAPEAAAGSCGSARPSRRARATACATSSGFAPPREQTGRRARLRRRGGVSLEQPVSRRRRRAARRRAGRPSAPRRRPRGGGCATTRTRWLTRPAPAPGPRARRRSAAPPRGGRAQAPPPLRAGRTRARSPRGRARAPTAAARSPSTRSGASRRASRERLVRAGRRHSHERRTGGERLELRDPVVLPARGVDEEARAPRHLEPFGVRDGGAPLDALGLGHARAPQPPHPLGTLDPADHQARSGGRRAQARHRQVEPTLARIAGVRERVDVALLSRRAAPAIGTGTTIRGDGPGRCGSGRLAPRQQDARARQRAPLGPALPRAGGAGAVELGGRVEAHRVRPVVAPQEARP